MEARKNFYIAMTSALSGLLFGYDTGIVASAMLFIQTAFLLTPKITGLIVSAVPAGALIASLLSGKLSDYFGRKKSLLLTSLLFIVGSAVCTLALNVGWLFTGRFIVGLAVGFGSCISPVYTAELAEENQRGWLVNIFVVTVQAGIFFSFLFGYLYASSSDFRTLFSLGIIPALLLGILALNLPESPRWLLLQGKKDEAKNVFVKLLGEQRARRSLNALEIILQREKNINNNQNHLSLWKPPCLKILLIGISVSFFTQTIGINMLNYYAPMIFRQTGFVTAASAILLTLFMGMTLTISTIASLFFIDKVGRRPLLLFAMQGILVSLLILTLAFVLVKNPMILGWVVFCGTVLFMLFHGAGIGPVCFLIPAEIFPLGVRGPGMGLSVASNWAANVIVAAVVPSGLVTFGPGGLFFGFFCVSVVGYFIFYLFVPETRGMTLEQIETQQTGIIDTTERTKSLIGGEIA